MKIGNNVAQEVELKLQIVKKDIPAFLALDCLKSNIQIPFVLKNTYYDTPNALLANHKIALRVRQKGDRFIQTLKTQGENQGGLHVRGEFEFDVTSDQLDLTLINKELLQYLPISNVDELDLKGLFCTDFTRTEIQLKNIEVVFDQGNVTYQDLSDEICEIELELKSHSLSNKEGIAELFELALEISEHISVMPSDVSKAIRGERLKQLNQGGEYVIKVPQLESHNNYQTIASYMEYIQTNWESYCFSGHSHYLSDALLFIDKLNGLLNFDDLKGFASKIIKIKHSWSKLLEDDALNDKKNPQFDRVQQDKSIGQTWLSLSRVCHQGANCQSENHE